MTSHTTLREFLTERHHDIVKRFVAEAERKDLPPRGVSRSLLVDHIPEFLDEIISELSSGQPPRYSNVSDDESLTARKHGAQRFGLGYDLEAVVREYGMLLHAIVDTAKACEVEITVNELDVLTKCVNVGVAEAVTGYVRYRDSELQEQKANLEFLATAGELLSSSLDLRSTLSKLMRLLVPRLADWCAIHLDDNSGKEIPVVHRDPAKAEILRELYARYPLPPDSPHGYPHVRKTGEPQLVTHIPPNLFENSAQNAEHLAMLRTINSGSWMIVPLSVQNQMFGALTLVYSDSGRHYSNADLTLALELSRRAAVALDNARLYQLSQEERSRVEAATRAKDEFVAMISHELRTPLNAILGWTKLMRNGTVPESKREHALEIIERNAEAQRRLVSDLLDISRAITGTIRITPAQVDLSSVIELALEDARLATEAKRLTIEVDLERDAALLRGDADRLQQVVWNLLANAIKFTAKGGKIWVTLRRVESDLELVVRDNGVGIPSDFLPHVFETFRQSDSSPTRSYGGLGIGLSITHHIVELHGGSITAESDGPGCGATFRVRLPISPLISSTLGIPNVRATKAEPPNAFASAQLHGMRVLVIDDEPDARELITYVLRTCDADVRNALSAAEALHELEAFAPHVIISDVGMPDEDGYSLIRKIRSTASPERKDTPAIALTAFASTEDRTRALLAGFNVHLTKPVEPVVLVQTIADLARHVRTAPASS